ncbi:aminoglycoside phosphotransferase family protein [Nocardioides sp. SYSU D00065]|uniref:aminoglycoside phosphotransferase family protein n=1 Tax=Nocardioides sp. SYSU D00065 TaxID=2817378 RepID=UPI0027DB413D|nr:aminoglycoside phosphotransferase family protein [Nocardioides sp. SYSU D00065]
MRLSRPPDDAGAGPGRARPRRPVLPRRLAHLLATIHDVSPTIEVRPYQSWAWEPKYTVPSWAADGGLWSDAFALLRTAVPDDDPCFIHRDFQPRNVLWSDDRISGVVDWVETSMGPAWLDVAHCCTNLAIAHGDATAERFAAAYVARTGWEPQPSLSWTSSGASRRRARAGSSRRATSADDSRSASHRSCGAWVTHRPADVAYPRWSRTRVTRALLSSVSGHLEVGGSTPR